MGCVDGLSDNRCRTDKGAHDLAKPISAIAHGQQFEIVPGPCATPSDGNRLGGFARGERALEFILDDKRLHALERKKICGAAQDVNDWNFPKLLRDMD